MLLLQAWLVSWSYSRIARFIVILCTCKNPLYWQLTKFFQDVLSDGSHKGDLTWQWYCLFWRLYDIWRQVRQAGPHHWLAGRPGQIHPKNEKSQCQQCGLFTSSRDIHCPHRRGLPLLHVSKVQAGGGLRLHHKAGREVSGSLGSRWCARLPLFIG